MGHSIWPAGCDSFTNLRTLSNDAGGVRPALIATVPCKVRSGGVSERPKEHASKACVGETPPWVQIPPPPPKSSASNDFVATPSEGRMATAAWFHRPTVAPLAPTALQCARRTGAPPWLAGCRYNLSSHRGNSFSQGQRSRYTARTGRPADRSGPTALATPPYHRCPFNKNDTEK